MAEETELKTGPMGWLARLTAFGIAGLTAAAAFAGMGRFLFNTGRDLRP